MPAPPTLAPVERKIDFATIRLYGEITEDANPIHTDRAFAAATEMGGIIAHGTLSLNLIWQSIRATFGPEAAAGAVLDVRFLAPVREDDVVTAGGERIEGGGRRYRVWVRDRDGREVIGGTLALSDAGERRIAATGPRL